MTQERRIHPKISREAQAQAEIGRTAIRPAAAWALVVLFLATIFAVPVGQHIVEIRGSFASQPGLSWRQADRYLPQCYDIFRALPRTWRAAAYGEGIGREGGQAPAIRRLKLANDRLLLREINEYTDALKEDSLLADTLLPPVQRMMSAYLGVGNEQAYVGRDGWLFYRPGVDYVTGPPFLSDRHLLRRRDARKEWQDPIHADPVPAIVDFALQLRRRGAALVLVPTPAKPSIHPEELSRRFDGFRDIVRNASFEEFLRRLDSEFARRAAAEPAASAPAGSGRGGIIVFDPAAELVGRKLAASPPAEQYLRTDTHWRPEAMDLVAASLAEVIRRKLGEPPGDANAPGRARFLGQAVPVTNVGDVARMLQPAVRSDIAGGLHKAVRAAAEAIGLPGLARTWATDGQGFYPAETVTIVRILDSLGNPWRPDQSADVLLLGDSFANIYSSLEMGWGDSAGLAERLSFHLRRPIDALRRNDAGAHATRQMLAEELRAGRDRLAGKKLVVWQFAERELAVGDWKPIELALGRPAGPPPVATAGTQPATVVGGMLQLPRGQTILLTGRIAALKRSPKPGTVTYKDHIMPVHLVDARAADGSIRGAQAVVLLWGLRDNQATGATRLNVGQEITVLIRPWEDVEPRYGTINTSVLDDVDIDMNRFWCEELR